MKAVADCGWSHEAETREEITDAVAEHAAFCERLAVRGECWVTADGGDGADEIGLFRREDGDEVELGIMRDPLRHATGGDG